MITKKNRNPRITKPGGETGLFQNSGNVKNYYDFDAWNSPWSQKIFLILWLPVLHQRKPKDFTSLVPRKQSLSYA